MCTISIAIYALANTISTSRIAPPMSMTSQTGCYRLNSPGQRYIHIARMHSCTRWYSNKNLVCQVQMKRTVPNSLSRSHSPCPCARSSLMLTVVYRLHTEVHQLMVFFLVSRAFQRLESHTVGIRFHNRWLWTGRLCAGESINGKRRMESTTFGSWQTGNICPRNTGHGRLFSIDRIQLELRGWKR